MLYALNTFNTWCASANIVHQICLLSSLIIWVDQAIASGLNLVHLILRYANDIRQTEIDGTDSSNLSMSNVLNDFRQRVQSLMAASEAFQTASLLSFRPLGRIAKLA